MEHEAKHIIINGHIITPDLIGEMLESPLNEWEKELYLFLNEWFSDTDFVLAQTSGSTGEPKPIELPKSIMIGSAERTIEYFGLKPGNRILLSLPCRFIAGKMMVVRAMVGQMNLVTVDPTSDFDFLENERFDFGAMVPTQVIKTLEQASGKEKLGNIHNLLIGGTGISSALENQLSSCSNRVVLTYGMTETASHIAIRELSGNRKSEYYRCLPGIKVSINESGCLKIHLPELHEQLQTNDLAELQSDTIFRINGRSDSVIISGGIKYSPEAIEKKLEPLINRRFAISSLPDEKLGEKLVLVIEGEPFNIEELSHQIKKHLPKFERPKAIVFMTSLPETDSGKVKRADLSTLIRSEIKE